MSRAAFYRAEANRCNMSAATCRDPDAAQRWREIAQGHQEVAERFEALHRRIRGDAQPRQA